MSHMILFSSFAQGEPTLFDLAKLKEILEAHECGLGLRQDDGYIPVFFPMIDGENSIGSDEGGIGTDGDGAIEFAIGRPLYDEPMKRLAFELLNSLRLCAYGDGSHVYSAYKIEEMTLPDDLLAECEEGISIVRSPDEMW